MEESPYYMERGYLYFKNSGKPLHRYIAKKNIWEKDKKKYPLEFWEYQVHHKDGNKLNNDTSNLELLTRAEHEKNHGLERREWDIIRILLGVIVLLSLSSIWGSISKGFSNEIKFIGFLIILTGIILVVRFLIRDKKGIRKIA